MVMSAVALVILFLFSIVPVQAQTYMVWGQVFGTDGVTPVDEVNVTVTDLDTADSLSDTTEGGGYYQTIFANFAHLSGRTKTSGGIFELRYTLS